MNLQSQVSQVSQDFYREYKIPCTLQNGTLVVECTKLQCQQNGLLALINGRFQNYPVKVKLK
jgi:hypothetical protein